MNRIKLEKALQGTRRDARRLLIVAWGMTLVAVVDGCVAVAVGRPLIILLDVFLFFGAAFQWACYLSVCSTMSALKHVQDAIHDEGQPEAGR